jgi:cytochrome c
MRKLLVVAAMGGLAVAAGAAQANQALAEKQGCTACHQVDKKLIGPPYNDVAKKYKGDKEAAAKLAVKVKKGGVGVWGPIPMPPNDKVSEADAKTLVDWVLSLAK